jgi:hypothetical protein
MAVAFVPEGGESAVVLAGEAGFVAGKQGKGVGLIRFGFDGDGELFDAGDGGEILLNFGGHAGEAVADSAGFAGPGAALAPLGGDHFLDEVGFDRIFGLEIVEVCL